MTVLCFVILKGLFKVFDVIFKFIKRNYDWHDIDMKVQLLWKMVDRFSDSDLDMLINFVKNENAGIIVTQMDLCKSELLKDLNLINRTPPRFDKKLKATIMLCCLDKRIYEWLKYSRQRYNKISNFPEREKW